MVELGAELGYAKVSIAGVISGAGVSRPTFYEYFSDKDQCFLAALSAAAELLSAQLRRRVADTAPELAELAMLTECIRFARHHPEQARLLFCEVLAGGPRSLDVRDRLIHDTVVLLHDAHSRRPADAPAPDLPPWNAVATVHWMLSQRLRSNNSNFDELERELTSWIAGYTRPVHEHRWRTIEPDQLPLPPPSPFESELPAEAPGALPPGRPRISRGDVARNQRERLMKATATVAFEKGYNAASITEIIAVARLDARVFYAHFAGKQQAFLAAHQLGFEHTMAVVAGAFFSASEWRERIWRGILAGSQFQASHPLLTHMLYVQSYAIGAEGIQRIEATHAAFKLFLGEGNQNAVKTRSDTTMEAIIAANFEIAFHLSRQGRGEEIARCAALMTYLCLAPFLGPRHATELIASKVINGGDHQQRS
ncbi:MAG TPA: TetR/AcrR family transcriptional regulator [Solirubrobacteraceae bacterium]|jgi:AcrR family transcriptional regulator|nr:TetR/AcrR family transcriptional regulator [Solirubrobacteraceae bacterium]